LSDDPNHANGSAIVVRRERSELRQLAGQHAELVYCLTLKGTFRGPL
jgi:hypothetical protein